jgi:undecaprenyl phosphate N,N'-diacetylbacillosamine 1-phosphate transferase
MNQIYKRFLKRFFDIIVAAPMAFLIFPLLLMLYLIVKVDSKGGFFFLQQRLGKDGKLIEVYKIRTMTDKPRESNQEIVKGNEEVTRVGKILRRLKIDELPQIINVLKGEMSFVGPRPCLPELQIEFDANGKKRTLVRPGLTGLAQTNGNIYLSWEERWKYDAHYVDNLNFILDFKILVKTIFIIFCGEEYFKNPNV